jgi:dihydroorotase
MPEFTEQPVSFLVVGGRVVDPASGRDEGTDLLIVDGLISEVGPGLAAAYPNVGQVEAAGLLVTPGFVDLHTHLRTPGQSHKETVATGTAAAAAGGYTTIVQMPNTEPPFDTPDRLIGASHHARTEGIVRVLTAGTITKVRAGRAVAPIAELAEAGAVAITDDGDFVADTHVMRAAYELAATVGIPVSQHCEAQSLVGSGFAHLGDVSRQLGISGRPASGEDAAVARDIALVASSGGHAHIQHLSSAGAVALVRTAKIRGVHVTAEVTPHHLVLTDQALLNPRDGHPYDTLAKCNPPLRTSIDVAACVEALADGTIDAIATDHAPHAANEKQTTLEAAPSGIIGLETAFSVGLQLVNAGHLDLSTLIHRLTAGPVAAWALDKRTKLNGLGSLAPGAPADITFIDLDAVWTVSRETLHSRSENTPFLGQQLRGRVVATIAAGQLVYELVAPESLTDAQPEDEHAGGERPGDEYPAEDQTDE